MTSEPPGRCGYRVDTVTLRSDHPAESCERPVWEDHDRCRWHARVDGKTKELLEETDDPVADDIDGAYLRHASLTNVDWFAGRSLLGADFTGADLQATDFSGADLTLATLTDASAIGADFTGANLEGAIFTNADLRRATLEDAKLHGTVLGRIHIGGGTRMGDGAVYDRDRTPPTLVDEHPLEAAAWVYRHLQTVYQDNALPELARLNYYRERDARRRLAWERSDFVRAIKWEVSRWVMGYGTTPYRVLVTSLIVIVVCALLFPLTGGIQEVDGSRAITYSIEDPSSASRWWIGQVLFKSAYFSVVTFATLGYGDIQPIGTGARFLAGVEAILGSLLAAILVFVLTRMMTW